MSADLGWLRVALAGTSAVVYFLVGIAVGRRHTAQPWLPANRAFQAWWFGLAGLTLFNPTMILLSHVEQGQNLFALRLMLFEVLLILLVSAIGCLVYYLLFLYTGRPWVFWPVVGYSILVLAWTMFLITTSHPTRFAAECSSGFCYEHEFSGTPTSALLVAALVVPIMASAVAYFALYFRLDDKIQKRRVAMVSASLVVWFGSSLVAAFVRGDFETASGAVAHVALSQYVYWTYVVSPLISLTAALVILSAYRMGRTQKTAS